MAQVDEHAEPIHLTDDLLTESRESTKYRFVGTGISPWDITAMGQRHVADTEPVEHAERC